MVSAHGMFHRMLACACADHHRITGHSIGKRHMFPCFHIASVFHCAGKVFADVLNRCQLYHISHQTGHA